MTEEMEKIERDIEISETQSERKKARQSENGIENEEKGKEKRVKKMRKIICTGIYFTRTVV